MNQVATTNSQSNQLSAETVREQVNLVQKVMRSVMKKDTHYGTIPGCTKPALYKAGSELLLMTFRIAVDIEVEDLSGDDVIRYRVKTIGKHQLSNIIIGAGIGECSSNEEKYKWRAAVCDEEFNKAPESKRRIKYGKAKGGGYYTANQVRTEPDDQANTILKMAKKRSQIDLTLTSTAASDIFAQDIEDLPEEYRTEATEQTGILPDYPMDKFNTNFPLWEKMIRSGKKPFGDVIATVQTLNKLTPDQLKKIMAVKVDQEQTETADAEFIAAYDNEEKNQ